MKRTINRKCFFLPRTLLPWIPEIEDIIYNQRAALVVSVQAGYVSFVCSSRKRTCCNLFSKFYRNLQTTGLDDVISLNPNLFHFLRFCTRADRDRKDSNGAWVRVLRLKILDVSLRSFLITNCLAICKYHQYLQYKKKPLQMTFG